MDSMVHGVAKSQTQLSDFHFTTSLQCSRGYRFPWWVSGKELTCQCNRHGFDPWVRKIPWRRKWQPTPVFFPGKFHGQRSLAGYSPWGQKRVGHNLATKQQQPKVDYMVKKFKAYKAVFNENHFRYQHFPFKCRTSHSYYDMVHNILWLYHHLFMLFF